MGINTETLNRAAAFFAGLVSERSVDQLSTERKQALTQELRFILSAFVPAAQLSPPDATNTWSYLLQQMRSLSQNVIVKLVEEGKATIGRENLPRVVYRLENRAVREEPKGPTEEDGLLLLFHTCIRQTPFPFGQCAVCRKVFVLPKKGKPKRYCSPSCKAKGVPSAAKRTEYTRMQRHKRRHEEILTTRRILRVWPKDEQWEMLQKAFPRKSRRQLLFLLRQAQQKQKEV